MSAADPTITTVAPDAATSPGGAGQRSGGGSVRDCHPAGSVHERPAKRANSTRCTRPLLWTSRKKSRRSGHGAAATPPAGYGAMLQEGVVRDVITDTLTDATDKELIEKKGREHLKEEILKDVKKHTDVKVEHVTSRA